MHPLVPLLAAGADLVVTAGAGAAWLPRGGQRLRLVATPALASEVRSGEQGTPSGEVGLSVGADGAWPELSPANGRPGWTLRVTRRAGGRAAVALDAPGAARQEARPGAGPCACGSPKARARAWSALGAQLVARVPHDRRHLILRAA